MKADSSSADGPLDFVDPAKFTPHFEWRKPSGRQGLERVHCESVSLESVAKKFGTPAYLYSNAALTDAYGDLDRGLGDVPHTLCFAVKSNGNLAILGQLAK